MARSVGVPGVTTPTIDSASGERWQRVLAGVYTDERSARARRRSPQTRGAVTGTAGRWRPRRSGRVAASVTGHAEIAPRGNRAMSLILDALKRTKPTHSQSAGSARHARTDAHDDTVLSTLGYPSARTRRGGLPVKMLLVYGVRRHRDRVRRPVAADRAVRAARAARDRRPLSRTTTPPADARPSPQRRRRRRRPPVMPEPSHDRRAPRAVRGRRIEPAHAAAQLLATCHESGAVRCASPWRLRCPRDRRSRPWRPRRSIRRPSRRDRCNSPARRARRRARGAAASDEPPAVRPPHARCARVVERPSAPNHFGLALYYQRIGDFDNALDALPRAARAERRERRGAQQPRAAVSGSRAARRCDQAVPAGDRDRSPVREGAQQSRRRVHALNRPDDGGRRVPRRAGRRSAQRRVAGQPRAGAEGRGPHRRRARSAAARAHDRSAQRRIALQPRRRRRRERRSRPSAIEHYRAFLRFGIRTHADLVARGPRAA